MDILDVKRLPLTYRIPGLIVRHVGSTGKGEWGQATVGGNLMRGNVMTRILPSLTALAAVACLASAGWAGAASAADPVKIGVITTLSGPGGYLGEDMRDAFQLAIDQEGGKLGGVPVSLLVQDDALKPATAKQIVDTYLQGEHAKILTGIIFSNVAGAVIPDVVDAGAFYISPNASPSNLAGKECNPNYFSVAWQNDSLHEAAGQNATNHGFKRMFILAPNYQAGKDALTGFKRFFKGEIVGEVYTKLDQTDFSAELAQIRAAKPDAVFQFQPGGLGITFLKQYVQAGLSATPMFVSAPSMDYHIMDAAVLRLECRFRQSGQPAIRRGIQGEVRPHADILCQPGL